MSDAPPPIVPLPAVLDTNELASLLRVKPNDDQVAFWCRRAGLRSVTIKDNGKLVRRFLAEDVLAWLRQRSRGSKCESSVNGTTNE